MSYDRETYFYATVELKMFAESWGNMPEEDDEFDCRLELIKHELKMLINFIEEREDGKQSNDYR